MDSIPDWLGVDLEDVAIAGEGEPEVEEEQHQGREAELVEDDEEEVTPSRMGGSSSIGQRPPLPSASRG